MKRHGNLDVGGNLTLQTGYNEVETALDGEGKNVYWDWTDSNSFVLNLKKDTTIHRPTGLNLGRAQQVTLVTKQPSVGFYHLQFGKGYIFAGGWSEDSLSTEEAGKMDMYSMHFSPSAGKIFVTQAADMFY